MPVLIYVYKTSNMESICSEKPSLNPMDFQYVSPTMDFNPLAHNFSKSSLE